VPTDVIVRKDTNISAGGQTKYSRLTDKEGLCGEKEIRFVMENWVREDIFIAKKKRNYGFRKKYSVQVHDFILNSSPDGAIRAYYNPYT